jgi:VIT1/CCC1 family predicted Fe2+/Mn2+ transporter
VIQTKLDKNSILQDLSRFSFGATSAIITSLALIVGLDSIASNPKMIIGALLALGIADNISDSLGIHVYRESQFCDHRGNKIYTLSNFLTRFSITMIFVLLVYFLPMQLAYWSSIVIGMGLLCVLSYFIALYHNASPLREIVEHVGVAVIVLVASNFLGRALTGMFAG